MNPFTAVALSWTLNRIVSLMCWCLLVGGEAA